MSWNWSTAAWGAGIGVGGAEMRVPLLTAVAAVTAAPPTPNRKI